MLFRSENADAARVTLKNYAEAIRRIDRSSPAVSTLRADGDGLILSTVETIERLVKEWEESKQTIIRDSKK